MEIWKAGDPEAARDALRFALQGCGDNLWVHVALGRIALEDFQRPDAGPRPLRLRLRAGPRRPSRATSPAGSPADARRPIGPLFDAIDGLAACHEALGQPARGRRGPRPGRPLGRRSRPTILSVGLPVADGSRSATLTIFRLATILGSG